LVQVFCATVYAFAIMLSCFLFGIFYGSKWISKRVDQHASLPRLFGLLELGLGVSTAALATLTYFVPAVFARVLFHWIGAKDHFAFGYVAAQFIVSAALILVPTLLMGATFPAAVRICTPTLQAVGRGVSSVYAANTIGAVIGALFGGMVLIPAVGTRKGLLVIAAIFVGAGILLLLRQGTLGRGVGWGILKQPIPAALLLLFVVSAAVGLAMPQQTVTNLYNYIRWVHPQVIYHGEGIAHNVDILRTRAGAGTITTMT